MSGIKINQAANFNNDFGYVSRASGIFYFNQNQNFKTTISLFNYWKLKRDLQVGILASVRFLDGRLLRRDTLNFDEGFVINYRPEVPATFEGTVEIEAFSSENMVIPYAALMAVYQTPKSISMVHSYARIYSNHEIEEGRTISIGEESCWTIRDTEKIRSFCIFHNGSAEQPAQKIFLSVVNTKGEQKEAFVEIPPIAPYATVKLFPQDLITGLSVFLCGDIGNARVSFKLKNSFTRMLVGNESLSGDDFQVTHSNFNYSKHKTDAAGESNGIKGYMWVPQIPGRKTELLIYPDSDPGSYSVDRSGKPLSFKTGEIKKIKFDGQKDETISFQREDGHLPARLVTGIVLENPNGQLPAECSLGVIHERFRARHTRWGLCTFGNGMRSFLVLKPYESVYGKVPVDATFEIRLFSNIHRDFLTATIRGADLESFAAGKAFDEIFPAAVRNESDFNYYMITSKYGGLNVDSFIENEAGCLTYEHAF
jgi:hypothetical protein